MFLVTYALALATAVEKLNGSELDGRKIVVSEARPKQ